MRRYSRLALFGLLAWCAFFWLYPRVNPVARFGFSIRPQASLNSTGPPLGLIPRIPFQGERKFS